MLLGKDEWMSVCVFLCALSVYEGDCLCGVYVYVLVRLDTPPRSTIYTVTQIGVAQTSEINQCPLHSNLLY